MAKSKRILLTGAAGKLGGWLRPSLAKRPGGLRSTDIREFGPPLPDEEIVIADLADERAMERVMDGVGAVVHLGGLKSENEFPAILRNNIVGTFNVFEAARKSGVKRIVSASSVHAIGYYPVTQRIDSTVPQRPDSYYGLAKTFGEDLASLFVDKAGMEIACLRIGSALDEPTVPRHLATWLSRGDLIRLVDACLDEPRMGLAIVYGASNNTRSFWDNSKSGVNYRPQDDAEVFAEKILSGKSAPADSLLRGGAEYQGGFFIPLKLGERNV